MNRWEDVREKEAQEFFLPGLGSSIVVGGYAAILSPSWSFHGSMTIFVT
jgi:hypothetical protein